MEQKIKVENKSGKYLMDRIPNTNIVFVWAKPGAYCYLTKEQIKELYHKPGGVLFFKNLIIHDEKLRAELLGEVEPEYYYGQAEVDILLKEGTTEQLEDALDFADSGTIDLIIRRAIELKIPDLNKREIIKARTGHDINKSIEFTVVETNTVENEKRTRRSKPIQTKLVIPQ